MHRRAYLSLVVESWDFYAWKSRKKDHKFSWNAKKTGVVFIIFISILTLSNASLSLENYEIRLQSPTLVLRRQQA